MKILVAVLLICMAMASMVSCAEDSLITLTAPHPLQAGEAAFLEIKLGSIDRGLRVEIETEAGRRLGVLSPFGVRSGKDAGTYTVPVPSDAIVKDRLKVRIIINDGRTKRTPAHEEIRSVILKIDEPRPQTRP